MLHIRNKCFSNNTLSFRERNNIPTNPNIQNNAVTHSPPHCTLSKAIASYTSAVHNAMPAVKQMIKGMTNNSSFPNLSFSAFIIKTAFRHSEKLPFLFSLLYYLFSGKVARGNLEKSEE